MEDARPTILGEDFEKLKDWFGEGKNRPKAGAIFHRAVLLIEELRKENEELRRLVKEL